MLKTIYKNILTYLMLAWKNRDIIYLGYEN